MTITSRPRLICCKFQSSLRPKAERNRTFGEGMLGEFMFQSSLRPKAERNTNFAIFLRLTLYVSILAPPEGGAQHVAACAACCPAGVSILAPPEGGAQRYLHGKRPFLDKFQSSLRPKAERNHVSIGPQDHEATRFNPRSARRRSATRNCRGSCSPWTCFNPRSARRRSATLRCRALANQLVFQSSLRPKAERNVVNARCRDWNVSILAPPEGGAQPVTSVVHVYSMFQSSLRPKAERNNTPR